MIIEVLFLGPDAKLPVQPSSLSIDQEYTAVEENAIYYTGEYVLRKLMKKYHGSDNDMGAALVSALHKMIGEDTSSIECIASYLDYVKTWTTQSDRGGLIHISNDIFRFFVQLKKSHTS